MASVIGELHVSSGGVGDACWHLSAELQPSDPVELMDLRHRQRARLMRYGRQSWYEFENRPVTELREAFAALMEIVAAENGALEEQ